MMISQACGAYVASTTTKNFVGRLIQEACEPLQKVLEDNKRVNPKYSGLVPPSIHQLW
jgi:hypothetical protein